MHWTRCSFTPRNLQDKFLSYGFFCGQTSHLNSLFQAQDCDESLILCCREDPYLGVEDVSEGNL